MKLFTATYSRQNLFSLLKLADQGYRIVIQHRVHKEKTKAEFLLQPLNEGDELYKLTRGVVPRKNGRK